jgi:hypothetical protein
MGRQPPEDWVVLDGSRRRPVAAGDLPAWSAITAPGGPGASSTAGSDDSRPAAGVPVPGPSAGLDRRGRPQVGRFWPVRLSGAAAPVDMKKAHVPAVHDITAATATRDRFHPAPATGSPGMTENPTPTTAPPVALALTGLRS